MLGYEKVKKSLSYDLLLNLIVNGSDPRMQIAALAVRGRTPLLDATVIASVTPTGGSRVEIVLKDDGQGY